MKPPSSFKIGDFYLYERDNKFGTIRYFLGLVIQNGVGGAFKQPRFLILASSDESSMSAGQYLSPVSPIELQERIIAELQEHRTNVFPSYHFSKTDFLMQTFHRSPFHTETTPYILYLPPDFLKLVKTRRELECILSDHFLPMPEYQHASILRFFSTLQASFASSTPPISLL